MPKLDKSPEAAPAPEAPAAAAAPAVHGPDGEPLTWEQARALFAAELPPAPAPAPAPPAAGPVVNVSVPPPAVPVDVYYELPCLVDVDDPHGPVERKLPGDGTGTRVRRVRQVKGRSVHVRSAMAFVAAGPDGAKVARPVDGGDPLPYGPGRPGCFGTPAPSTNH